MKRSFAGYLSHLVLILALLIALASCCSQEAKDAMTIAQDDNATFALLSSSGSGLGMRESLPNTFPRINDLIQPGSNARTAMLSRFWSGTMYDDMELVIYAYALEQLGDKSAVSPLRQFVSRNIGGPFQWSPHFAAHAILSLTGELNNATDINWYSILDLQSIAKGGTMAASSTDLKANAMETASQAGLLKQSPQSCGLRYLLVDGNDQPLYLADGKTKAVIEGTNFACPKVSKSYADHYNEQVQKGGGSRYTTGGAMVWDGEYGNAPTRYFDCAGYALRRLNDYHKWWVNPTPAYRVLTEAKVVRRIDNDTTEDDAVGDMIFYFPDNSTAAQHVAEVHAIGVLQPTVWNADGMSGLFEASAAAGYFDTAAGGLPDRKIYRWVTGQPRVIPDPDFATNPGNCLVNPVVEGTCPDDPKPNPLKPDNACPANGSLCQWCGGPATGTVWDIYAMIAWRSETKLDQIDYEATNSMTGEYIDWNVTFSGGEPYNATLTVTHNKITGTGGSGKYRASSADNETEITSADILLDFSGWHLTGTLVVHTKDGKQATVEVKAAHCDGTYP